MRTFFAAAAFVAIALTGCVDVSYLDPFAISPDAGSRGTVIITLDNPPDSDADDVLSVVAFDPVAKTTKADAVLFQLVTDDAGHNFLLGTIPEGEAVITSGSHQDRWTTYFDAGTYHFFVKGGAYNFIGRYNDEPSYKVLDAAIAAGKLPSTAPVDLYHSVLYGQTLTGFTPGEFRSGDKDLVAALVAKKLGHPVAILTPALTWTDMPRGVGPANTPSQDAAQPPAPPAAPVAPPAADGAAKPAATITWQHRQVR